MSTFIVNLNDTIVLGDTIRVKVAKVAEVCQPVIVKETETSCNDVKIVAAICATIVLVAAIIALVLFKWLSARNKAQNEKLAQEKRKNDSECLLKDMETERARLDAEVEREHKKAENELHRERYKQETDQMKLDSDLKRKNVEIEANNEMSKE